MPRRPDAKIPVTWALPTGTRSSAPERYVEVWIDIDAFDELWFYTDQYLRHPREASVANREAYAAAGERFLAGRPMPMPAVRRDPGGVPSFDEGRHRYLWMREHGVPAIPLAVLEGDAKVVRALCGTRRRTSWFILRPAPVPNAVVLGMIGLAAAAMGLLLTARS